jgi:ABC-type phosphate/phosphonate transport system substrate-binding protein
MLDRNPGKSMADLRDALPKTWLADHVAALRRRGEVRRRRPDSKRFEAMQPPASRSAASRSSTSSPSTASASSPMTAPGAWCAPRRTSRNWWSWSRARRPRRACARCSPPSRRFEATFLTATAFATASAACDCVEPLVIGTDTDGNLGYHAVLVVGAGSAIASPADLAGMRLAVSARDSVAGRLLPLALFAADGVDIAAIDLVETGSPEAAMQRLLAGDADAALAWTSLTGERAAGFSRGVLSQMVAEGMLTMDAVEIAWTSPLIPNGPLSVLATMPIGLKEDMTAAMLDLAEADPPAFAAIGGALGGPFVAADGAMFRPLVDLFAAEP